MPQTGIEPVTLRSSVLRSPNWAIKAILYEIFSLTLKDNRYIQSNIRFLKKYYKAVYSRWWVRAEQVTVQTYSLRFPVATVQLSVATVVPV